MSEDLGLWQLIRSDLDRYRSARGGESANVLGILLLCQGFWASTVYRMAHAVETGIGPKVLRAPLRILFLFAAKAVEIVTGVCLPAPCRIGPGLYVGHFGPLILHPGVTLGAHCNLSQGVTLGWKQGGAKAGAPRLGDRVYVGPNAVVIGAVQVGDDAAIGAGAVVLDDVPPRGVVAGNPARLVSRKGSFDLVRYPAMEEDSARQASLAAREAEDREGTGEGTVP